MWIELKTIGDFDSLKGKFDDFSESILREIYWETPSFLTADSLVRADGKDYARLLFQGGRETLRTIELLAVRLSVLGLSRNDWSPYDFIDGISFTLQDGLWHVVCCEDWDFENKTLPADAISVVAERLFWRPISDNLGRKRYLANQNDYEPLVSEISGS